MAKNKQKNDIKNNKNKINEEAINKIVQNGESCFTGNINYYYFIRLVSFLSDLFSVGIAYPFIACWQMRWEAEHTYISGKKLVFTGRPLDIFVKFIKWWFLTLITLGGYYFFKGKFSIHKWKIKHTHFSGEEKTGKSVYKGSARKYNKAIRKAAFIKLITIGLGASWTHCYIERWSAKKTIIDGYQLSFDGAPREYFCKKTKGIFLSIITLGIYSFWLVLKSKQWEVAHTHCKKIEKEQENKQNEDNKEETSKEDTSSTKGGKHKLVISKHNKK